MVIQFPKQPQCCICKGEIDVQPHGWRWGHNAAPVADGRCCDACNFQVVIPARLENLRKAQGDKR